MFRSIYVNSIFCIFLFFGCKKTEDSKAAQIVSPVKSMSGLLTSNDTLATYDIGLKKLSQYGFFKQPLHELIPATDNIIPYELNSPLFTDYASKKRFISLPQGTQINYKDLGALDFPNGTVLIKNFYYKDIELETETVNTIIETRLLIKDKVTGEWTALPYIWNEEQTEAYLYILGKDLDLNIYKDGEANKHLSFKYSVPNVNMCKNCHVKNQDIVPLGPTARQLNRENVFNDTLHANQMVHLMTNGKLAGLNSLNEAPKIPNYLDEHSGSLNDRARAYLDVNCAHCHQSEGSAKTSGLHLTYEEEDYYRLGVNKAPVAAGQGSGDLSFDIVKGKPDESILLYRMKHLEPGTMMPEIGKNLLHEEGISIINDWIASLK